MTTTEEIVNECGWCGIGTTGSDMCDDCAEGEDIESSIDGYGGLTTE